MKIVSRAALSVLLLSSAIYGQGGEYSLDNTQFLVEPGNLVLEHALWDYHHYYPKTCDLKFLDLSINPVYKHWKAIDGHTTINTAGAFIQGQLNFGDLWLRVNTIFGNVKQKLEGKATSASGDTSIKASAEQSHFGIDDVILKGGYDLYFNGDDHLGFYITGGFPTKRNLKSQVFIAPEVTQDFLDDRLLIDTPHLGTKHFRVGGGINGGFTLMDCDEHHLTLMLDTQYHYAFPADYGRTSKSEKSGSKDEKEEKSSRGKIRFTPGHTVNAWTALHYAYGNCNFELGSAFTTTFSKKVSSIDEKKESKDKKDGGDKNKPKTESSTHELFKDLKTPDTIKFGATPYVAFSYNSTVFDNPATLGVGVGYDFNALHNEKRAPHKFQGVVAWVNASMSF